MAVSYRTITCAKHRNWYKDTEFLAETVKNRETWLDHERIASTSVNSRGNLSKSERAKTDSLVLGYLLWRNHRFQGARKSVECRFETRDGPGHRGSLSETTESNQVARHLPIFDLPLVSSSREKQYWVVRASTKKIQSFCYRRRREKMASVVNWRNKIRLIRKNDKSNLQRYITACKNVYFYI